MVAFIDTLASGARDLGIDLDAGMVELFERYQRELVEWSRRMNLSAIESEEEVAAKHFLDSLTCVLAVDLPEGCSVADVGSGAGFPGVVLKVARPSIKLTLIEASRKRTEFLRHIADVLGLGDVEVVWDRAERLGRMPNHRESHDVAVARAVAELAVLAELCLPLVRIGGALVAQKGPRASEEVAGAVTAVEAMGGRVDRLIPASLPLGYGERTLVVIRKESPTPGKYPRRPGIPEKRPIRSEPRGKSQSLTEDSPRTRIGRKMARSPRLQRDR